ncbi:MAG TPA: hypothetical protein VNP20_05615 [Nocardioidaceae bacterium]|nr:hypothetical protein [Nocardioidaceae bacterium]
MRVLLAQARTGHAGLFWFAVLMAGLAVVAAAGVAVDERVLLGAPIWLKPFKFAVSFGLYAFVLAWMLSLGRRGRRTGAVLGWVIVVGSVIEMGVIVGQVVRGRASHFNESTPLDAALFSLMGATILLLWLATAALAVVLVRRPGLEPATAWAIRLGLVVGLVGMALGMLMILQPGGGAHAVGVPDGGPGLALTGWSTTGGDLRVGHAVGLHALQLLPLLAAALSQVPRRLLDETARVRLVWIAAAGYAGVMAVTTWQALRAQPLLSPDSATLTAVAVLVTATGVAVVLTVVRRHHGITGVAASVP